MSQPTTPTRADFTADQERVVQSAIDAVFVNSGADADRVTFRDSEFSGPATINTGDGIDVVNIRSCNFTDSFRARTGSQRDRIKVNDSMFEQAAIFRGQGGGACIVSDSLLAGPEFISVFECSVGIAVS